MTPSAAAELQPFEIYELSEGDQERWNRTCRLFAWGIHKIVLSIPFAGTSLPRTLAEFLQSYPPPGYRPGPDEPTVRRVRPEDLKRGD